MKPDITLGAYRRHLRTCPFFGPGGRNIRLNKCSCPFHVDGIHHGTRVRDSLGTRNQQVAEKKVADLIRSMDQEYLAKLATGMNPARAREVPNITEAIELFLGSFGNIDKTGKVRGDLKYSSWRKYRNSLHHLAEFCRSKGIQSIERVETTELEQYRRERVIVTSRATLPNSGKRAISQRTWKTELQSFRTFFGYCVRKKWITTNCAAEMKGPRNLTPNDVVPYTTEDEIRILAACDQIGGGRYIRTEAVYERLRAKAMILVLRHTALRISDVVQLRKDAVYWDAAKRNWHIRVRTTKTGESVHLPIPQDLKDALDALPLPRNAPQRCAYFFWNGVSTERAVVGIAERSLSAVFKKSGVPKAHAHRYRHTLATRLLARGASYELVANILGNTPEVVRKHYGKWSKGLQDNIDQAMMAHHLTVPDTETVTNQSREKTGAVN